VELRRLQHEVDAARAGATLADARLLGDVDARAREFSKRPAQLGGDPLLRTGPLALVFQATALKAAVILTSNR
jgi:hypothetical protein